ncbi:heme biosynthesis HemY N-terminal domain-containing protein, partial [Vulcaniibacterium thermophilum]
MRLFRHLVFWIALAVLGALAAQLLLDDPGYVLIRYGGWDRSTTLAGAVLILLGVLLALWLAWKALTLPFAAFRRYRARQARTRLLEGLDALHQGHWSRAETLLAQAAQEREAALAARLGAARAALARGDEAAAAAHL